MVREMDNPVLACASRMSFPTRDGRARRGAATGDRLPLLVYRVNVDDGQEALIRGARLSGLTLRAHAQYCRASETMPRL